MRVLMLYIWPLAVALLWIPRTLSHGRLKFPASRGSMWRYGFNNPINYNDNENFCGGQWRQWHRNGGQCGTCGDPYDGPREHEANGKYANGVIAANFREGDVITITVEITANHLGWFEFRLCPVNDPTTRATQACLDRYLLREASSGDTRIHIGSQTGEIDSSMRLPQGLTCSQCVLQWKYHTGNSWGIDPATGRGCLGCGPQQEEFYGCADITIDGQANSPGNYPGFPGNPGNPHDYSEGPGDEEPTWRQGVNQPATPPTNNPENPPVERDPPRDPSGVTKECRSAGAFAGQAGMDEWCQTNCDLGNCPTSHCECYYLAGTQGTSPSTKSPVVTTTTERRARCTAFVSQTHNPQYGPTFADAYCHTTCTMSTDSCPSFCRCMDGGSTSMLTCRARDQRMRSLPHFNELCSAICSLRYCPYECECQN